ncbi:MAG: glycosyltransferase family 2 protein [Candidatus Hydrogenedentota bacterium]|nr:MAG: glycosyltransferase family 2 protein [Candidatus Hydrogenedentota bacterium]
MVRERNVVAAAVVEKNRGAYDGSMKELWLVLRWSDEVRRALETPFSIPGQESSTRICMIRSEEAALAERNGFSFRKRPNGESLVLQRSFDQNLLPDSGKFEVKPHVFDRVVIAGIDESAALLRLAGRLYSLGASSVHACLSRGDIRMLSPKECRRARRRTLIRSLFTGLIEALLLPPVFAAASFGTILSLIRFEPPRIRTIPSRRKMRPDGAAKAGDDWKIGSARKTSSLTKEDPAEIIVTNYNTREYLAEILRSLSRLRIAIPVTVVDDASTDGSAEFVRERYPEIRLIAHERNRGYAASVNDGLEASRAEILFLCNSDLSFPIDPFEPLIGFLEKHRGLGAVTCRMEDGSGRPYFNLVRDDYGWKTLLEQGLVDAWLGRTPRYRRWHNRLLIRDPREYESEHRNLASVSFAFVALRREALERTGGIDETFRMYFDDPDLCRRMRKAGYRIGYLPVGPVVHYGRGSTENSWIVWERLARGRLRYLERHGPRSAIPFVRTNLLLGGIHRRLHPAGSTKPPEMVRVLRTALS